MTRAESLAAYAVADGAYKAAYAVYDPILTGFRARTVSTEDYCAARKVFDAARDAEQAAYILVQDSDEEEAVEIADASQVDLFEAA